MGEKFVEENGAVSVGCGRGRYEMRLDAEQRQAIREVVAQRDPEAEIVLFGSRAREAARGGDIDWLILSPRIRADERRKIKRRRMDRLGAQKSDLRVARDRERPRVRIAPREGVLR
jgi:predicted nucleotidyltransferase